MSVRACTVSIRCARALSALARAVCSLCRLAAVPPIEAESWSRRCAVAWRSLVATRSTVAIRPSASAVRASSSVVRVAWASFSVARTVSSWAARATVFQPRRASAMAPLPSSASSRVAACSTPARWRFPATGRYRTSRPRSAAPSSPAQPSVPGTTAAPVAPCRSSRRPWPGRTAERRRGRRPASASPRYPPASVRYRRRTAGPAPTRRTPG